VDSVGEELERLARLRASGDLSDSEYELLKAQLIERESAAVHSKGPDRPLEAQGASPKPKRSVHTTLSLEIWDSIRNSDGPAQVDEHGWTMPTRIGEFPVELASSPSDMFGRVRDWEWENYSTGERHAPAMSADIYLGNRTNHIRINLHEGRQRDGVAAITVALVPADHPRLDEVSQKQKSIVQAVKEQQEGYQRDGYLVPSHPDWEGHWCFIGSVEYTAKHLRYIEVKIGPSFEDVLCIGRAPNRWVGSTSSINSRKVRDKGPSPWVVLTALEELRQKTWSN